MKLYTVFIERNISKINCLLDERVVHYSTLLLVKSETTLKQLKPRTKYTQPKKERQRTTKKKMNEWMKTEI